MNQATSKAATPLTGVKLLKRVDELADLSKREKAKVCGYVKVRKNGTEQINLPGFYEALLEAKGIQVNQDSKSRLPQGRGIAPTYKATVHQNGQIVIGRNYTQKVKLEPGTELEIKVGYKHIKLIRREAR